MGAEPSKHEPRKLEPSKHESRKHEPSKHESRKHEPSKLEPSKHEPSKHESRKHEPRKLEPSKHEPSKHESRKHEPRKLEPSKHEPSKHESRKLEPRKLEPSKHEPSKHESRKHEPRKLEPRKLEPRKNDPRKLEPRILEPKDRVFIMIGSTKAGKSTLGNLLLGEKSFKVLHEIVSYSTTMLVTSSDVELTSGTVLGMNLEGSNVLRIKVIDQPGLDDANFDIQDHCKNLIKCMLGVYVKTFPTFLIVINLSIDNLSDDRSLLLNQLSESLSQSSYSLFSHAVVVFTHIDKLECDINDIDSLKQIVMRKCQNPNWEELRDILDAVDNRYMFVNGTNPDALNRNRILRELFILSKSIRSIRFHGNNYFTSDFLKRKLGIFGDQVVEEELYKFDYQFSQDLNLFWRDEMRNLNLEQQIEKALISMVALGEGVSSVVILVSLLKSLSTQMKAVIYDLPSYYFDEDERKKDWWDHVFFVFEVPNEESGRESVETNLARNRRLKTLVEKGSKKWTWIAEDTPQWKCRDRIAKTCLEVRKQIGGMVFIQDTVVKELDKIRKDADRYKGNNTQITQYSKAFHDKMAKGAISFIQSDNRIIMKFGGIFIRNEISIRSMRMILRNTMLSNDDIERFKERYKDPNAKVTVEEILEFLANP